MGAYPNCAPQLGHVKCQTGTVRGRPPRAMTAETTALVRSRHSCRARLISSRPKGVPQSSHVRAASARQSRQSAYATHGRINGSKRISAGIAISSSTVKNALRNKRLTPPNGRFLRHRHKRSERCQNYENCTKASPHCQSGKVCRRPSVKTMLGDR